MSASKVGNIYKFEMTSEADHRVDEGATPTWQTVHARLGHIPYARFKKLEKVAEDVPVVETKPSGDEMCEGCCLGKMRESNFPRHPVNKVTSSGVLELIHTDVMGPMQTMTPGGCRYAVVFADAFYRHDSVAFMKKKSEVLQKFRHYKAAVENQTGAIIKRMRSDNGGEYFNLAFKKFLVDSGIQHERTVAYTPQQNVLAERMNRSLVEMASSSASSSSSL